MAQNIRGKYAQGSDIDAFQGWWCVYLISRTSALPTASVIAAGTPQQWNTGYDGLVILEVNGIDHTQLQS